MMYTKEEKRKLIFKKLAHDAIVPRKGSEFAAGYDWYCYESGVVPPKGKGKIGTGIAVQLPTNTYGRVAPRSGWAWKHSIDVGAGVIDEDYRGELWVILFNHGNEEFKYEKGMRIAQIIVQYVTPTDVKVLEVDEQLEETERGEGKLGSTGYK